MAEFDYTSVPFESSGFYPDRILRDEQIATRQFWDSPNLSPSLKKEIDALPSGAPNYDRERAQSGFIKDLRDLELRSRGTESRYHPGAVTTDDEPYFGLSNLLAQTRAQQMAKYAPTYGMSEKQKERFFEGPPKSWQGYGYGDRDAAKWTEPRYYQDVMKEFSRSALGDVGWFADVAGKGLSQTLWPFDFEGPEGDLPRGWKDLFNYSNLMADFDQQSELNMTEEQWERLGYSEKEDIKKSFKDMTGSKWDYDPTYHPLTEESGFKDLIDTFSEEHLTPSSDYLDVAAEIPNPLAFETTEDKTFDWTPLKTAEVGGMAFTGIGALQAGKKLMKKYGKQIPEILRKNPKLAAFLGLTTPSVAAEFVD
tara:strand:+ start:42 stop:1139 length:1098 start_codon:yes stop_codon:yes gene_type:complete